MSGPEMAVAGVGALAAVAVLGVVALLVQVRALRRELAAAVSPAATTPDDNADGPGAASPVGGGLARREAAPRSVPAPTGSQIVVATMGHPLVRVASVTHGLRQALTPENRDRIRALVRRDLRRREKLRRRAARRAARVLPAAPLGADEAVADHRDLAS